MTIFILAALLSALCTPVSSRIAMYWNIVAVPGKDRWHCERVIPRLGGIAIFSSVLVLTVLTNPWQWTLGLVTIFSAGFRDDIKPLSIASKLITQATSAIILLTSVPFVWVEILLIGAGIIWIMFTVNMYNMLDNMDGAASATGATIFIGLAAVSMIVDNDAALLLAVAFAGALLGFLFFNIAPAKVFMGDAGSHVIGAAMGLLALELIQQAGVLILLLFIVPLTDFVYVTLKRLREGRSIVVGGRDHLAHDLHRRGLTEREIMTLYTLVSGAGGFVVWMMQR